MLKYKEKVVDYKINKNLEECIGHLGDFSLNEEGCLICKVKSSKIDKKFEYCEEYELDLIGPEELNKITDSNCIKSVCYDIVDNYFNKKLKINVKSNDVVISILGSCLKSGLHIDGAKCVKIFCDIYSDLNNIDIKADEVEFLSTRLKSKSNIEIICKRLKIQSSCLKTPGNINVLSENIQVYNSSLESQKLYLNSKKIEEFNNTFKSHDLFVINNDNCNSIKNVDSKKIVYNGTDITNSEGIMFPKLRNLLLEQLKELRYNCYQKINEEVVEYQKSLSNNSISKTLSKRK